MINSHTPNVFTWHVHGAYLYYLSHANINLYIPVADPIREGYYGRGFTYPFKGNVIEVPEEEVRNMEFDCVLYQSNKNYLEDKPAILSKAQQQLPSIYLEHNTPANHPTDHEHCVKDSSVHLVHVTHYNRMMWKHTHQHISVIEHGVPDATTEYGGNLAKGLVVINHIRERGRIAGWDLYEEISKEIPLDLIGMGTEFYDGKGEILHSYLDEFLAGYRFLFNPMRYTSFGLAVCEAMSLGLPIVSLATTEYPRHIQNGYNGFCSCDPQWLMEKMKQLIQEPELAQQLGLNAKTYANQHFSMSRFTNQWENLIHSTIKS